MLTFNKDELVSMTKTIRDRFESGSTDALLFSKYIKRVNTMVEQASGRTYPYEIRIPKPMSDLLRGDFEPAQIIRVEKPIILEKDGTPIWVGDSIKGVTIHYGYKNGDSRYMSDIKLADGAVHGILAGMTGAGKSVALNNFIFGACMEYAPWHLRVHLSDAKIVEFKRYGTVHQMPHIASIAATGDTGYTVSVLENLKKEMDLWNAVFTKAGVQNLKDFIKETKLTIPRNLIVVDEFQYMFTKAGKKLKDIQKLFDSIIRAGRNSGYHFIFASQELGSDFNASMLGNVKARSCLKCAASVSEKILGNAGASKIIQKGKMFVNLEPDSKTELTNTMFRVPYQPDGEFAWQGKALEEMGKRYNFRHQLNFYDEQNVVYEEDPDGGTWNYDKYIRQFTRNGLTFFLGEPSYVTDDEEKVCKINFSGDDKENILVWCPDTKNIVRYIKMLIKNIQMNSEQGNKVATMTLCLDRVFRREINLESVGQVFDITSIYDSTFEAVVNIARKRKLFVKADEFAFMDPNSSPASDKIFYEEFGRDGEFDTDLNRHRFHHLYNTVKSDARVKKELGIEDLNPDALNTEAKNMAVGCLKYLHSIGVINRKINSDMFPPLFVFILGINRLIGIGRDPKSQEVTKFKNLLLECTTYNVRFIIGTTSMENISDVREGVRYVMMDGVREADAGAKVKCMDFPEEIPSVLGIIFDNVLNKTSKFKKMYLAGELLGAN